jgi:phospholipase/carboxylesterase
VALRLGLPQPELFVGVAVLSGALRRVEELTPTLPPKREQSLFVAHGRSDELVPCDVGRDLVAYLRREGYRPEFRTYAAGHEINLAMLTDLEAWLTGVLPG